MPYIVTTSIFPTEKGPEVAEKYLEALLKYPPDENLVVELVPAAVKSTHEGIKTLGVIEVKEGKLEDALQRIVNMMVIFQDISGYRYSTDIYYKIEEALALIGMRLPE